VYPEACEPPPSDCSHYTMPQLQLTVPPGFVAGQSLQFVTPEGQIMAVDVPPGVPPGATFVFTLPDAPLPMGLPLDAGSTVPMGAPMAPARKFAECPICYENLCAAPVGFFLSATAQRVSPHYFNLAAAQQWLASGNGTCPLTRKPIATVMVVPDVRTNPDAWFTAVDVDGNNKLSRFEAIEALKAQFALDVAGLDAAVADPDHWMWQQWDVDRSGTLERNELLAKPSGLVASLPQLFASTSQPGKAPDITDRQAWFDFWDSPAGGGDGNGVLDKEEVIRALIKTLRLSSDPASVQGMRATIDAVWGIFDTDGSGTTERCEFLQADGLADTIVATLAQR